MIPYTQEYEPIIEGEIFDHFRQVGAGVGVLTWVEVLVGVAIWYTTPPNAWLSVAGVLIAAGEKKEYNKHPISSEPLIVEKIQNGGGLGVIDTAGLFIPNVNRKRIILFSKIKGVTMNEISPHQPSSIVLPVELQK